MKLPADFAEKKQSHCNIMTSTDDRFHGLTRQILNTNSPASYAFRYSWVFWFMNRQAGSKIQDYTNEIKKVCTLTNVQHFN